MCWMFYLMWHKLLNNILAVAGNQTTKKEIVLQSKQEEIKAYHGIWSLSAIFTPGLTSLAARMLHFPSSNKCYFIKVPTGFFPDSRPPHKVSYSKGSREKIRWTGWVHAKKNIANTKAPFASVLTSRQSTTQDMRACAKVGCRVHLRRAPHSYVINPRDRRHSRALVCSSRSLATIPLRKEKTAHSQVQKRGPRICILETSAIFSFSYVAYTATCRWTASRDRSVGLCPGYVILGESGPKQGLNLS